MLLKRKYIFTLLNKMNSQFLSTVYCNPFKTRYLTSTIILNSKSNNFQNRKKQLFFQKICCKIRHILTLKAFYKIQNIISIDMK